MDLDWWGLLDTVGKGIEDGDGSDGDGWVGMVMHVIWAGASLRAEFRGGGTLRLNEIEIIYNTLETRVFYLY